MSIADIGPNATTAELQRHNIATAERLRCLFRVRAVLGEALHEVPADEAVALYALAGRVTDAIMDVHR